MSDTRAPLLDDASVIPATSVEALFELLGEFAKTVPYDTFITFPPALRNVVGLIRSVSSALDRSPSPEIRSVHLDFFVGALADITAEARRGASPVLAAELSRGLA